MIVADIQKKLKIGADKTMLAVKLKAEKGSITIIHGPSGAGKTTFLKAIAGLTTPEYGKITVDGQVWYDTSSGINLLPQKRMAGFVFQNYALFSNMTVLQHLHYATNDTAWIKRLLQIGNLENFTAHKPDHLSGGQQQRLAILRAMAVKPYLLLMDEPFSALDQKTRAGLIANLMLLWTEMQTTVIIVSHNPEELNSISSSRLYVGTDQ